MPFTPAHPAVLLPARFLPRKYISWTALIIGSMVPDMEYFFFMNPGSRMSHTIYGIVNFNLPVTLLLAMAWHQFTGPVLLRALPFLKKFYTTIHVDFAGWLAKNWLVFLVSALAGIGSHLFLDGFCHSRGFMVERLPYLQEKVAVMNYSIQRCYVIWYIASAIGLLILFLSAADVKSIFSSSRWKQVYAMRGFFFRVLLVTALIAGIRVLFGLKWNVYRHLVVIAMGAFSYAILAVTMYEKYIRKA